MKKIKKGLKFRNGGYNTVCGGGICGLFVDKKQRTKNCELIWARWKRIKNSVGNELSIARFLKYGVPRFISTCFTLEYSYNTLIIVLFFTCRGQSLAVALLK